MSDKEFHKCVSEKGSHLINRKNGHAKPADRIGLLEKQLIWMLIQNVKTWREETSNDFNAKIDESLVHEDFQILRSVIRVFYDSRNDDNPSYLADSQMESAERMLKKGKFADALVVLLNARDGLYGIEV